MTLADIRHAIDRLSSPEREQGKLSLETYPPPRTIQRTPEEIAQRRKQLEVTLVSFWQGVSAVEREIILNAMNEAYISVT